MSVFVTQQRVELRRAAYVTEENILDVARELAAAGFETEVALKVAKDGQSSRLTIGRNRHTGRGLGATVRPGDWVDDEGKRVHGGWQTIPDRPSPGSEEGEVRG